MLRLPSVVPWSSRIIEVRKRLDVFDPDWTSLQFVPFGYHPKGLCFGLGKWLAAMNAKAAWHIMFHELWLGMGDKAPIKHRVLGALQRQIILDLTRRLRPRIVNTQAELYREALSRQKIKAAILPLFSNIPLTTGDGLDDLLEPLVTKALGRREARARLYLAGVFGAVAPEWNADQAVNTLLPLVQRCHKRLVLVFHGKNNLTPEAFNTLSFILKNRADIVAAGKRSNVEISKILQSS